MGVFQQPWWEGGQEEGKPEDLLRSFVGTDGKGLRLIPVMRPGLIFLDRAKKKEAAKWVIHQSF